MQIQPYKLHYDGYMPRSGFTLIELLIVFFLIFVILFLALGNYMDFFRSSVVESDTENLLAVLRIAKSKSIAEESDSRYKVVLNSSSFSLQTASGQLSQTQTLDSRVTASFSASEIIFEKLTGESLLCTPCTVTLSFLPTHSPSKTITVTSQGVISSN